MEMDPFLIWLLGWALMALVMTGVYVRARQLDNYGWVDVFWSYGIGLVAVFYALLLDGWWGRDVLVAGLAAVWSLRLGTHLWYRVGGETEEDGRYKQMREDWKGKFAPMMFGFYQLQAFSIALLTIPLVIILKTDEPAVRLWEWIGAALFLVSIVGERIADNQLARFKQDPQNRGKTCREGLWRYSRHPNYFFEWLHWVAYAVMGLGLPLWWATPWSALVMLLLILKVTGIPPTEAQAVRSRGEDYRRYQRETSAFFPWFPKKEASA